MDSPVTFKDACNYLGIDDTDDPMVVANVNLCIDAADAYIAEAVGAGYDKADPEARLCCLALIADFYDSRGTTDNSATAFAMKRAIQTSLMHLRLKYDYDEEVAEDE